MELKNRSVRVAEEWMDHIKAEADALTVLMGRNVKAYEVLGAAIMAFNPSQSYAQQQLVDEIHGAISRSKVIDKVGAMSKEEKERLANMLGISADKLKNIGS